MTNTTNPDVDKLISFGQMALEQGWYEQAREHFEQALVLDADDREAMKGLARANEVLSRRTDAASFQKTEKGGQVQMREICANCIWWVFEQRNPTKGICHRSWMEGTPSMATDSCERWEGATYQPDSERPCVICDHFESEVGQCRFTQAGEPYRLRRSTRVSGPYKQPTDSCEHWKLRLRTRESSPEHICANCDYWDYDPIQGLCHLRRELVYYESTCPSWKIWSDDKEIPAYPFGGSGGMTSVSALLYRLKVKS
jgi:hypothetical protein